MRSALVLATQYAFTRPKRLCPYFLHDHRLLGLLSRTACDTPRELLCASLGERDVVPRIVVSIQTFGSILDWHPHLHLLVTDGASRRNGEFLPRSSRMGHARGRPVSAIAVPIR